MLFAVELQLCSLAAGTMQGTDSRLVSVWEGGWLGISALDRGWTPWIGSMFLPCPRSGE